MDLRRSGLYRLAVAGICVAVSAPVAAVEPDQTSSIAVLRKQVEQQSQMLAQQQRLLQRQVAQLQRYKRALDDALAAQRVKIEQLEAWRATGAAAPSAASTTAPPARVVAQSSANRTAAVPPQPVGRAPAERQRAPDVAPLGTNQPGVLTPKGRFVLEPSLEYSHSSNNRVALVGFTVIPAITIGLIDIRSVNRDFFTLGLTGRYGLSNRLEVEMRVPYVYRADSTLARPLATASATDSVFDVHGNGLGDIELAARYQFNQGSAHFPYLVGTLRFKTTTGIGPFDVPTTTPIPGFTTSAELPTGTGFYALQPSITALFPSDPAVFFGGIGYIWNIKRTIDKSYGGTFIHTYDPGDAVTLNFGMGLALNSRASFSVGYEHDIFFKDKQNGQTVPNAQVRQLGQLQIGWAYSFSKDQTFNLSLGVGVTDEAPDITLNARLPTTF